MNALALSRVWNVASLIYVLRWVSAELNTLIFRFFWSGKLTVLWCNLFVWVVDSGIEFCLVLSITTRSLICLICLVLCLFVTFVWNCFSSSLWVFFLYLVLCIGPGLGVSLFLRFGSPCHWFGLESFSWSFLASISDVPCPSSVSDYFASSCLNGFSSDELSVVPRIF